jgi:hypothetical protein
VDLSITGPRISGWELGGGSQRQLSIPPVHYLAPEFKRIGSCCVPYRVSTINFLSAENSSMTPCGTVTDPIFKFFIFYFLLT